MLYALDGVLFDALETNVHDSDATAGHDWAEKPLLGAAPRFEATGAIPNPIRFQGRILPHVFGAGSGDLLKSMANGSQSHMLIRGDGQVIGWHVIKSYRERHTYLDTTGVGRVVEFDLDLISTPIGPSIAALATLLTTLFK